MRRLAQLVMRSKMGNRIKFVGPVMGAAKWHFYRSMAVVALPSLSEVIGLVNLEAAACGTPTITTFETGLDDWEEGGGILVHPDAGQLAEALTLMASLTDDQYRARSSAARRIVEQRYSWAVVEQRWRELYAALLR